MSEVEAWEDPTGTIRFYFTHSSAEFTTGVMIIQPQSAVPKHNRPLAVENLVQISGQCVMEFYAAEDAAEPDEQHQIAPGDYLQVPQGRFHVHANPHDEPSVTLFKAAGDITAVMDVLRQTYTRIDLAQTS